MQEATIVFDYDDGVFEVTCNFAVGSQANGCYVELNGTLITFSRFLPRVNRTARAQHHFVSPLGELTYSVFDWEKDGSIGTVPVVVHILNGSVTISESQANVNTTTMLGGESSTSESIESTSTSEFSTTEVSHTASPFPEHLTVVICMASIVTIFCGL